MPVYTVQDMQTIAPLFSGWNETMIWSCLSGTMGVAYADSLTSPRSAQISVGDFCPFAGKASDELAAHRPGNLRSNYALLIPQRREWELSIERVWGDAVKRHIRHATKKDKNVFDKDRLRAITASLGPGYELRTVDQALYDQILSQEWSTDLCVNYVSFEKYQALGIGVAVLKNGEVVSGASSYASYPGGIEIEVDTRLDERQRGLASACCAQLILNCLERGLYPSWDAHNPESLALSKKLGYVFDREYVSYEIEYP